MNSTLLTGHGKDISFFFLLLLDSPIIGRVTATAWRQLLRARNSPSPHDRPPHREQRLLLFTNSVWVL